MSYASIASHNIPKGEMPKPDQGLADGHFAGETSAHHGVHVGEKINVLEAGTDLEHPPIEDDSPARPEPIVLHHAEPETSHALNVAPAPTVVPIDPKWEHVEKDLEEDAKKAAKKTKEAAHTAEKKTKEAVNTAEKKTKEAANTAADKTKEAVDAAQKKGSELADEAEKKGKEIKKKAQAELQEVENALAPYWEKTKDIVLRPGTLGGLMGVVNVGLLSTLGYFAYTRRDQPWDRRVVGSAVAGTLALFGAEGYVTESYLSTPEGRAEAERAKREGSRAYMQAKEVVLRPGVAGGLAGFVNVAIIGTVSYFSYKHWNERWDNRVVSAVAAGLIGLSGLEGYASKAYVDNELPKRR